MNTNETVNVCGCVEEKKCGPTINFYGYGCSGNDTGGTGGNGDGRSPYIGENGNWVEWSVEKNDFDDTGVRAEGIQGEKGDIGPQGPQGLQGPEGPKSDIPTEHLTTGVETLTNLVLDGKPVYQMFVDCGSLPQVVTAGVQVEKTVTLNIAGISYAWIEHSQMLSPSGGYHLLPWISSAALNSPANYVVRRVQAYIDAITASAITLRIANTGATYNDYSWRAVLRYTKS